MVNTTLATAQHGRRLFLDDTAWDICARQQLTRPNANPSYERLDPGVNFFVLALEAVGAVPRFSCEGHPKGFYVAFEATYELATEIHDGGFFRVEIEGPNYWSIRLPETTGLNGPYGDEDRIRVLRWAATAWGNLFGARLGAIAEL